MHNVYLLFTKHHYCLGRASPTQYPTPGNVCSSAPCNIGHVLHHRSCNIEACSAAPPLPPRVCFFLWLTTHAPSKRALQHRHRRRDETTKILSLRDHVHSSHEIVPAEALVEAPRSCSVCVSRSFPCQIHPIRHRKFVRPGFCDRNSIVHAVEIISLLDPSCKIDAVRQNVNIGPCTHDGSICTNMDTPSIIDCLTLDL